VYQSYYEIDLLRFHSASEISWIGTVQGFILVVFSVISGPIFDRGYFRALIIVGSFLVVIGMLLTSFASEYWQLLLTQGLCVGFGAGCLFLPSLSIVATGFTKNRALAIGLVGAGGSVGSVIYPIVFSHLQPKIGFGWATRVITCINLFTLSISILIMKARPPLAKKPRALIDLSAFRSPVFIIFSAGLFLTLLGLYIPFFYVIIYAEQILSIDENLSFYVLVILNAASLFGRIIPGLLADNLGALNVTIAFTLASSILTYAWIVIRDLSGLIVFCILYGFSSGAVISLPATVVAGFAPDFQLIGTWMGMSYSFAGLGLLIGNPIDGAILNIPGKNFIGGLVFSASAILAGGLSFVIVRTLKAHSKKSWKM
jgi:MFS family permease